MLKQWLDVATCHGVADIHRFKRWPIRMLWISVIVLFLAVSQWFVIVQFAGIFTSLRQIYEIIKDALKKPQQTTNVYARASSYTEFPLIRICNNNRINMTQALLSHQSHAELTKCIVQSLHVL